MKQQTAMIDQAPLISPRFVWKLTAAISVLCLLTVAISISGRFLGQSMLLAGHTTDETPLEIIIGNDVLILPTNVVRFEKARRSGVHDAIDTYFTWPGMMGYTTETRDLFSQTDSADGLIFVHLNQATMSKDMTGRFGPIYRRLVEGSPVAGPGGLVSYRIKSGTGYASELLYADPAGGTHPYVVRCLVDNPTDSGFTTQTGCQRDIAIGEDLSLTYRFSINLLEDWQRIEADVRARFEAALSASL